MGIMDMVNKTIDKTAQPQPREIVKIMLNPDNTIAVGSCFTDKKLVLEALLEAVKVVALSTEVKTDTIIKPTAAQVMKVNK